MSPRKPKRVALYLRVSTGEQTTRNQRRELKAVAERHGWNLVATYEDAKEALCDLEKFWTVRHRGGFWVGSRGEALRKESNASSPRRDSGLRVQSYRESIVRYFERPRG